MRNLILFALLLVGNISSAITIRGGLIATDVTTPGVCSVTSQLLIDQLPTSLDTAFIDWGDGIVEPIPLAAPWPVSPSNGSHLLTLYAIWHQYSNGIYNIRLTCGKRVPWIRNMSSSGSSDFALQATVVVNPIVWNSLSCLSDSFNLEAEMIAGSTNIIPLGIDNGDNDSVVWSLSSPIGVTGYSFPDQSGGGVFSLSPIQGQYEWNPVTAGLYSAAITFSDFRELSPGNWFFNGSVTREILIDVGQVSSVAIYDVNVGVIIYPNPSITYTTFQFLGAPISREIIITDQLGREIWRKESSESIVVFTASEFAKGMYFYSISGAGSITNGKFLIQH